MCVCLALVQHFEEKFKELRVEGCRKENSLSTSVMFTEDDKEMEEDDPEDDPEDSHTETEDKETLFMGTQSEARRRFSRNGPYCSRPSSRDSRYGSFSRRQSQYTGPKRDGNRD